MLENKETQGIIAENNFLSSITNITESTMKININPSLAPNFNSSIPFLGETPSFTSTTAFNFVPPKWYYLDPMRIEQGPFTAEKMNDWYRGGYFSASLPIKCTGDPGYIQLIHLVEKYGNEAPFLAALRDQENLEREFHMKSSTSRPSYLPSYNIPHSTLPQKSSQYVDVQVKPQESNYLTSGSNAGLGFSAQTPFVYNRNLNQFGAQNVSLPFGGPSQFMNPVQVPSVPVGRQESPAGGSAILDQVNMKSSFVAIQSPVLEPEIQKPAQKVEPKISPSKTSKIPNDGDTTATGELERPKSPSKSPAPVAPWAVQSQSKPATSKETLKEIQEKEKLALDEKRRRKEMESEQKILAEAQLIAQKEASEISIISNSRWGTKPTAVPNKSLAEIMKDEEAVRKSKELTGETRTKTGSFARAAAATPGSAPIRKQNIVSQKQGDNWSTVGKATAPVTQSQSPLSRPIPVSISMNRPASLKSSNVLDWCKSALTKVQGKSATLNSNN